MTDRELMQTALDALEKAQDYTSCPTYSPSMTQQCAIAAVALRARLAQPEPEPVAWMHEWNGDVQINKLPAECYGEHWTRTPLYTAPPQREWCPCKDAPNDCTYEKNCRVPQIDAAFKRIEWQGLTDEEIQQIEMSASSKLSAIYLAEAQLKGKNAL